MRKAKFVCFVLMNLMFFALQAQELQMSYFGQQTGNFSAQKNPRYDLNDEPCALLKVSVARVNDFKFNNYYMVGEVLYLPGEAWIYMAQGATKITVSSDRFGSQTFQFEEPLVKGVTYEMKLKLELPEDQQRKTLVMADVAYNPSQMSYGAMVGVVAKHGAYLHVKSDLNFITTTLSCDDSGLLSSGKYPYYKPELVHKSKHSVTGGYMYRIIRPLYAYAGAGYGNRLMAWETVDGELVRNKDHSTEGVAVEIGAIGTYKNFALSVGCQSINFKYVELNVGFGMFF